MSLTKAWIINEDTQEKIICLFNPSEYEVSKANQWTANPIIGKNVPPTNFTGGNARLMNVELFFDREGSDIRPDLNKLWALALIDDKTENAETKRARPPLCTFHWGSDWSFKAVITSLSVRYTLFYGDGTPLRATAKIVLQEAVDAKAVKEQAGPSGGRPGYKTHTVLLRETLDTIAYDEYGVAEEWRMIADENNREDPLDLQPGEKLVIPPLYR